MLIRGVIIIGIIDFLIMLVGGFILFLIFTALVVDHINRTFEGNCSKKALEEVLKDYGEDE